MSDPNPVQIKEIREATDLVRSMLQSAFAGDVEVCGVLRMVVDEAKDQLLAARKAGRKPSATNFETGQRQPWTWERSHNGAYNQLLFLGIVVYALIVYHTAVGNAVLSQTAIATDTSVYRDVMKFLATDTQLKFDLPFPYTHAEMRRAYGRCFTNNERYRENDDISCYRWTIFYSQ